MKTMREAYGQSYTRLSNFARKTRYYKEIKSLLRTLHKYGFEPYQVDDDEELMTTLTQAEAAVAICNVDQSRLFVKKGENLVGLFIVLGNEPGEAVCDHTLDDDLDKAVTEHYERWSK